MDSGMVRRLGFLVLGMAAAGGCETEEFVDIDPPEGATLVEGDGAESFVSHQYGFRDTGGADAGLAAGEVADERSDDAAARAIEEADIIQRDGTTLYALSQHTGLSTVDLSNPAQLKLLGNHRERSTPFEMYLRDHVAYLMLNDIGRYDEEEGRWITTSLLQAIDVHDLSNPKVLGEQRVPGRIADSRIVGDVLYLVSFENGYCWHCDAKPRTLVSSFDVGTAGEFGTIDTLAFEGDEHEGSWRRTISVTSERIYVAGVGGWRQSEPGLIQVVDIADPEGSLALGAEVTIEGRVESRWQIDEYEGVLRVISQRNAWTDRQQPLLQTYRIVDSHTVEPLATLRVELPMLEDLRAMRFDGPRGFAITFPVQDRPIDPLITFDLSDPAAPKQLGELEMPGWVYHVEPRGERLYALGFAEGNLWGDGGQGGLTVSVFDVSDMEAPAMLDRETFGGQWARMVEDQDRIHKAFNLRLDRGLILVPFAGSQRDEASCLWKAESGIQILSLDGDQLELRGVAPQQGQARRSLLMEDTLVSTSDETVQTFSIENLDDPAPLDVLEIARRINSLQVQGDTVVRFGTDYWQGRTTVDVTSRAKVEQPTPLGDVDLSLVDESLPPECNWWGPQFDTEVQLRGEYAYLAAQRTRTVHGDHHSMDWAHAEMTVFVINVSNRAEPAIVSSFEVEKLSQVAGDDGHAEARFGGLVVTDSALLVPRHRSVTRWVDEVHEVEQHIAYDVYDLAKPEAPEHTQRVTLPDDVLDQSWGMPSYGCMLDVGGGWWGGWYRPELPRALVSGDVLVSHHAVPLDDGSDRLRFFLDRLDVSDPTKPKLLNPVNVPGAVVAYDADHQTAVTLEETRHESKAGRSGCWEAGFISEYDYDEERCYIYERVLNGVSIRGDKARRESRALLDQGAHDTTTVAVSDTRIFVAMSDFTEGGSDDGWGSRREKVAIFGRLANGKLWQGQPLDLDDRSGGRYWRPQLVARGKRAFITESYSLLSIDASGAEPETQLFELPGWRCSNLQVAGDDAFCSLGARGVQRLSLD